MKSNQMYRYKMKTVSYPVFMDLSVHFDFIVYYSWARRNEQTHVHHTVPYNNIINVTIYYPFSFFWLVFFSTCSSSVVRRSERFLVFFFIFVWIIFLELNYRQINIVITTSPTDRPWSSGDSTTLPPRRKSSSVRHTRRGG